MLKLFQVCFYTGILYTVISFVLGHLLDFAGICGDIDIDLDADLDLDINIDGGIDFDGHMSGIAVSPLKPITIAAFVTVFGGTGMILLKNDLSAWVSLIIASAIGFTVSFILYRFIVVPLYKAQNTSAVSQAELIGSLAHTALAMKGESYGKIIYTVEGNTYSAPAKSIDGRAIEKGVPVVIIDIKKNLFYVKEVKGGRM